jgi:hypothetical protein
LIDPGGVAVDLADSDAAIVEQNSAFPFRHRSNLARLLSRGEA